jgi:hypothetical protein
MCNPTRFVNRCVSLAKEAGVGRAPSAVQKGTGGYADWIMLTILLSQEMERRDLSIHHWPPSAYATDQSVYQLDDDRWRPPNVRKNRSGDSELVEEYGIVYTGGIVYRNDEEVS